MPERSDFRDSEGNEPLMGDGKECGRYGWSYKGPTHSFHLNVPHNTGDTKWEGTWTFTGLPSAQLVPGQKIRVTATGTVPARSPST